MRSVAAAVVFLGVVIGASISWLETVGASPTPGFQIIVHPKNPSAKIDKRLLADIFLKRVSRWPDGEIIHPVDLRADSHVRRNFVEDVLNRSMSAIKNYWQQLIFSGANVPPPELESDDAIVRYVLSRRGAIGYVSDSTKVGNAKALALE